MVPCVENREFSRTRRLRGQGLELSRPMLRTSKCVLEAKDVDSTSAIAVVHNKN